MRKIKKEPDSLSTLLMKLNSFFIFQYILFYIGEQDGKEKRYRTVNAPGDTRKKIAGHLHLTRQHILNLMSLIINFNRVSSLKLKNKVQSLVTGSIAFLLSMILAGLWCPFALAEIQFEDVSQVAGIFRWGDSFGASWGDFNGDGWPDLWVGNHCADPSLYLNNSDGTFTDATDLVKYDRKFEQHGAAWADFDNDGDQDLIQIVGGGREKGIHRNQFFVNSDGLLQNKAADFGLEYPLGRGRTPLWFDWNSDGYLDIFVTNINRSDGEEAPSVLFTRHEDYFRNDNGLIVETGLSSNVAQLFLPTFMSSPSIVVHGYNSPSRIYEYDSSMFHDITNKIDFPKTDKVSDISIADFNNDLFNDFFLVTAPWGSSKKDRLLIQNAEGFQDATTTAGIDIPTSCWSVASADFDNDMDVDLYLVCSGVRCNTPNILYENLGDGTFRAAGGAEGSSYGRGDSVTTVDYNNDGFVDIFVTNRRDSFDKENSHNYLYRNVGNSNHWIEIELEGIISNRDGIGALLLASSGRITQMRVQGGGIHQVSQDHQRIHFGLSKNTLVERLTIQWPSGIVQEIYNISADQIVRVVELDFKASLISETEPLSVAFISNTRDYYKPVSYKWDFDNDGTFDSILQNPSYTYNNPGIYTVKLIVTDSDGRIHTSIRKDYLKLLRTKEDR